MGNRSAWIEEPKPEHYCGAKIPSNESHPHKVPQIFATFAVQNGNDTLCEEVISCADQQEKIR
jgi:hypothetical protein